MWSISPSMIVQHYSSSSEGVSIGTVSMCMVSTDTVSNIKVSTDEVSTDKAFTYVISFFMDV